MSEQIAIEECMKLVAVRFRLPRTYGDRMRFLGQCVLIVAVGLGQAEVAISGCS